MDIIVIAFTQIFWNFGGVVEAGPQLGGTVALFDAPVVQFGALIFVSVPNFLVWTGVEGHQDVWLKNRLLLAGYLGDFWTVSVKFIRHIQLDADSSYSMQLVGKFVAYMNPGNHLDWE